jgi:WD40 repeat protein
MSTNRIGKTMNLDLFPTSPWPTLPGFGADTPDLYPSSSTAEAWRLRSAPRPDSAPDGPRRRFVTAASPDGATLAIAARGRAVRLYRRSDGRTIRVFSSKSARSLALAFAPDGRSLASAGRDGVVRIWDPRREVERRELAGHAGPATALAYSPDGALLATAGRDGVVRIWEPDTGRLIATFRAEGAVASLAFGDEGAGLVATGADGEARRWDLGRP